MGISSIKLSIQSSPTFVILSRKGLDDLIGAKEIVSYKGSLSSKSWAFWSLLVLSVEGGSVRVPCRVFTILE
jgi:hypothetical protein